MTPAIDAIRAALSTIPPAISGKGGSRATARAACVAVRAAPGASPAEIAAGMAAWNAACTPPWTGDDLARRIAWAIEAVDGEAAEKAPAAPPIRTVRDPESGSMTVRIDPAAVERAKANLAAARRRADAIRAAASVIDAPPKPAPAPAPVAAVEVAHDAPAPAYEVVDIECWPNTVFMVSRLEGRDPVRHIGPDAIRDWLATRPACPLVTFNGGGYDLPMIRCIAAGADTAEAAAMSARLVSGRDGRTGDDDEAIRAVLWEDRRAPDSWPIHYDVYQLLRRGADAMGLKAWQLKMGLNKIVETPHDFTTPLPADALDAACLYCEHDVDTTLALYRDRCAPLIAARQALADRYGMRAPRLMARHEAGIALDAIMTLARARGIDRMEAREGGSALAEAQAARVIPLASILKAADRPPAGIPALDAIVDTWRGLTLSGRTLMTAAGEKWDGKVTAFGIDFQLGVGGIHSIDAPLAIDDADDLFDIDVESYYPSLMITRGIGPRGLGGALFAADLAGIKADRVAAKAAGETVVQEALKIVINSSFGQTGCPGPLYDLDAMLRVTIGGQLGLLYLAALMDGAGIKILSANTDGLTLRGSIEKIQAVKSGWEKWGSMKLELTKYKKYFRRDVNNYIAITDKDKVKSKGFFSDSTPKGASMRCIRDAATKALISGASIDAARAMCIDLIRADATSAEIYGKIKAPAYLTHGATRLPGRHYRFTRVIDGEPLMRCAVEDDGSVKSGKVAQAGSVCIRLDRSAPIPLPIDEVWYADGVEDIVRAVRGMLKREKVKKTRKKIACAAPRGDIMVTS